MCHFSTAFRRVFYPRTTGHWSAVANPNSRHPFFHPPKALPAMLPPPSPTEHPGPERGADRPGPGVRLGRPLPAQPSADAGYGIWVGAMHVTEKSFILLTKTKTKFKFCSNCYEFFLFELCIYRVKICSTIFEKR